MDGVSALGQAAADGAIRPNNHRAGRRPHLVTVPEGRVLCEQDITDAADVLLVSSADHCEAELRSQLLLSAAEIGRESSAGAASRLYECQEHRLP
jgi:hypothetical protein